ncbi:MAG: hypothetical protein WCG93_12090 [Paludibacter sp.]
MILAVDFDGTIHTGNWPNIGEPRPNSIESLRQLKKDGHFIIIWTCREGKPQTDMVNWLLKNNIPFDQVNEHKPGITELYGYPARKVYAHLYIDDKQIGGLPHWNDIYNYIKSQEETYSDKVIREGHL